MSNSIVQLNEEAVKSELKDLVRTSVEATLNELLNKEAEELTSAAKYERTETRQGYRSGHYNRKLTTTAGDVTLEIPKLKGVPFETAIIEHYRRRKMLRGNQAEHSRSIADSSAHFFILSEMNLRKMLDSTEVGVRLSDSFSPVQVIGQCADKQGLFG